MLSAFIINAAQSWQQSSLCSALEIKINYDEGNFFIDKSDVEDMIRSHVFGGTINIPAHDLDLQELEDNIRKNPYVESAEVYLDINNKMWVEIKQRQPIIRIIDSQNLSYYLSKEGEKMPASMKYASRVPIASGYISDNGQNTGKISLKPMRDLYQLALYIDGNQFLKSLIEQVYIEKNGDITLIPNLGNQEIIFGPIENITEKFDNLLVFYTEGLNNVGWNKYKTINLKFKGQIVCTKK